jgi:hypothetical protein
LVFAVFCFVIGIVWLLGIPFPLMDAINSTLGVVP